MNAMRQAVAVSRMREGGRILAGRAAAEAEGRAMPEERTLAVNWKEALYLATLGGMRALGLRGNIRGSFEVGAPFDAQHSEFYAALSLHRSSTAHGSSSVRRRDQ